MTRFIVNPEVNIGWQLVVSDLDGTLLDSQGRISAENQAAVAELAAQGIGFTLATGRLDRMARAYVGQLQVRLPIIACNGAIIRDCRTEEILFRQPIQEREARELIGWLVDHELDYLCYSVDTIYYPDNSKRISSIHRYNQIAAECGIAGIPIFPLADLTERLAAAGLIKILAILPDQPAHGSMREYLGGHPGLNGQLSSDIAMDITAGGTSKGHALRILAGLLGVSLSRIAAFGDNDNDITLLAAAGLGVAMGNASQAALAASQYQTAHHDESGFAAGIRRFILRPAI